MRKKLHTNLSFKIGGLAAALLLLAAFMLASVMFGVNHYSWDTIVASYTQPDGSNDHLIIQTSRIPRALIAAIVGGSLAVAGALMQAITRNPLASPSIFGVNAGAAFAIVLSVAFFDVSGLSQFAWIAFLGAAVSSCAVYLLGSVGRDGLTPIKITLAGSAITALFSSLTQGILLADGKAFDQVLFWLVGSVAGRTMEMLLSVLPYMLIALVGALLLSPHINVLTMGEDVAKGLGQHTLIIKASAAVVIVLLAGGSVAVAGPVVFVGIIVPHIVRYLVGIDYRWVLPYCAVLGALLLVGADIGARFIVMPKEVHVGVTTALIGVPFFVYIARKGGQWR
ncbi:FecCD family ABC transporter permease [Paenibacillus naphthalenovorans]|uniref:FecCD family ABC transporter permease n=1 Tax=Paenibacillus naphthalenovorans TaxID=162209 RepID=UPI0008833989|nr:iron ABC transporter permease [Paenibacillus naphthalenovorans]GCL74756.1 iron ABC transporter permease [Paenibacillus naphthalenovorans]SDJ63851.1 iron complex transport system permease protein [Paenibacillus naphthalenovorans]